MCNKKLIVLNGVICLNVFNVITLSLKSRSSLYILKVLAWHLLTFVEFKFYSEALVLRILSVLFWGHTDLRCASSMSQLIRGLLQICILAKFDPFQLSYLKQPVVLQAFFVGEGLFIMTLYKFIYLILMYTMDHHSQDHVKRRISN